MPSSHERIEQYQAVTNPPETVGSPESELVRKLEEDYRNCYPHTKFGEVSLVLVDIEGFVGPFEQALEKGFRTGSHTAGDKFLVAGATRGLDTVYVVKAPEGSLLAQREPKAWEHHQPKSLEAYRASFQQLNSKITSDFIGVEPLFLDAYTEAIDDQVDFCESAQTLGTPEYTIQQRDIKWWQRIIDSTASTESGELVLVHEQLAKDVLEKGKDVEQEKTRLYSTVKQALDFWKFNDSERSEIIGTGPVGDDLTPEQGVRLFDVLRRRLGLDDWRVVVNKGSKAININSNGRLIEYPETRFLTPDEIVILPPHELGTHAISGENGGKQPCPLLRTGLPDYIATQEGLAAISEMVVGEPFGHPRQRLFAARYLAAAMSLKTVEMDGRRQPKYTLQEIYDTLRSYKLSQKDAAQTIWRLARGTSLQRQVVDIPLDEGESISVTETFAKDVIYFEGLVKLRDFFMQTVPLLDKEISKEGNVSIHGKTPEDFSTKLLARVGRAIETQNVVPDDSAFSPSLKEMRTIYDAYVSIGRDALMGIMQNFLVGKLRFEDMSPSSPWHNALKRDGLVEFRKLFEPTTA